MAFLRKNRVGLALGGGGARGLAHIGVIRALERENVPVDILVGTSIGALVGGAYASGMSPDEMENRVDEYLKSPIFETSAIKAFDQAHNQENLDLTTRIQSYLKNRFFLIQAMFRPGILSNEDFQATIDFFVPDIRIEETRLPFRAVATDLVSGELIVFSRGSLRQAVMASCAVPGAVMPLKEGEKLLSDGGIICLIPSSVARMEGADVVIAVAVDRDVCADEELRTVVGIYHRVSEIMSSRLRKVELDNADVVILPEVGDIHWTSFSRAGNLIREGEGAVHDKIHEIRKATRGLKGWFKIKGVLKSKPLRRAVN